MKSSLILFAALALSASAQAAPVVKPAPAAKPVTGQHDSNAPITISSDSFQADLNAKSGTYSGNVVIVQADMKLRANVVKLTTVNDKIDKVVASGNVVVDSPNSGTVTGDNGVYSVVPRIVVMTGNVIMKKGKDVMRGVQLTVNLATGQAVMGGGKAQTGVQATGRVQGVFLPNSQ
jgi:lipopolysaccharide export system protein LptA